MERQNVSVVLLSVVIIFVTTAFIFTQGEDYKTFVSVTESNNDGSNARSNDLSNSKKSNTTNKNINSRIHYTFSDQDEVGIYISPSLGITFEFVYEEGDKEASVVKEDGNIITVNDSTVITVFDKDPKLSLKQEIEQKILKGYDPSKCWVATNPIQNVSLYGYDTARIEFPVHESKDLPWWENAKDCPPEYTSTNGVSYYLYDPIVPEKFAFVNKGQAVAAFAPSEYGNKDFAYTIKFMSQEESKINSLIEYGTLDEYSISPYRNHVFFSVNTKGPSYYLYNLDTGRSILPDADYNGYYVYGLDEFNNENFAWFEDKLFIASSFSSHGAEGFPGIVQVDLKTDNVERIVDFTNECPFTDEKDYPGHCIQWYKFEIKNIENNKLTYIESFNEQNDPYTKYNYSVEKVLEF